MKEQSIIEVGESRPVWEALEAYAREGVRRLLQQLLEEEVEEVLGRRRYERREGVDARRATGTASGKPRRLSLRSGTITVRRPRVRGLEARFESRLLPLFKRRTEEVGRLLPELYLHGLAHGDFDLALRGLLGAARPAVGGVDRAAEGGLAGGVRDAGSAGGWTTSSRCTSGWTASTSRRGWRRTRRRCSC